LRHSLRGWLRGAAGTAAALFLLALPAVSHPSLTELVVDQPGIIVEDDVVITGTFTCAEPDNFVVAVKDLRGFVDGTLVFHLWGKYTRGPCTGQPVAWTAVANHGCGQPTPGLSHLQMSFLLFEHGLGSKHQEGEIAYPGFPLQGVADPSEHGGPPCKAPDDGPESSPGGFPGVHGRPAQERNHALTPRVQPRVHPPREQLDDRPPLGERRPPPSATSPPPLSEEEGTLSGRSLS
jgi:hypothetical protein